MAFYLVAFYPVAFCPVAFCRGAILLLINPLGCKGNYRYSATSNSMKLVHWPLMVGYIWYSEEGPGQAAAPPSPLIVVPNVTAYP